MFSAGLVGYEFVVYSPTFVDGGVYPVGPGGDGGASEGLRSELLSDGGALTTFGEGTVTLQLLDAAKVVGAIDYQFVDDAGNVLKTIQTTFTAPFCPGS